MRARHLEYTLERKMIVVAGQRDSWEGQPVSTFVGELNLNIASIACTSGGLVARTKDLLEWMRYQDKETEVIAIDDCQELSNGAIEALADSVLAGEKSVVLSGIDVGPDGHIFESTGLAMAYADKVFKVDSDELVKSPPRGAKTTGHVKAKKKEQVKCGRVTVFCGCMFAGKTGELISRSRVASLEGLDPLVFRPSIDTRGPLGAVITHDGSVSFPAVTISRAAEISRIIDPSSNRFIAIDEAQFLGDELIEVVRSLRASGVDVFISTLDRDFTGQAWRAIPRLLSLADEVIKMMAICNLCGKPASTSFRKITEPDLIRIGGSDTYEPRCKNCFTLARSTFEYEGRHMGGGFLRD